MKLHEDTDVLEELISFAADTLGLPEIYIEKDYWVTRALKHLAESEHAADAVFKGGTSLSKAYRLIERFSEDVDLALFSEDLGSNQLKKKLKVVEQATNQGLVAVADSSRTSKGSNYRKTVYQYPRTTDTEDFGQASPELLLEINGFATPEPHETRMIRSLIADALVQSGKDELIVKYGLEAFPLQVLSVRRTMIEKLLRLIKVSYSDDPIAEFTVNIRHFYDLCMILRQNEYRAFLESDDLLTICDAAVHDDRAGSFQHAEHLDKPLHEAPLFKNFNDLRPLLEKVYQGDFALMVTGELPGLEEVEEALRFIHENLERLVK